jgi:hypothetical protein
MFICCLFDRYAAACAFLKIDTEAGVGAKIAWPRPRNGGSQICYEIVRCPSSIVRFVGNGGGTVMGDTGLGAAVMPN